MNADERTRRWRLVLGEDQASGQAVALGADDAARDAALAALYGGGGGDGGGGDSGGEPPRRSAGLGSSSPKVAAWLGDIRECFPSSVVEVMQRDAIDRLGLRQLLFEPEVMRSIQPDIHMVTTLMSLRGMVPARARDSARTLIRTVVEELEARLAQRTRDVVTGALRRHARTRRPRPRDIDWNRTIAANLRTYQPDLKTVIPERLVGFSRARSATLKHLVLCIDQSGSMGESVVFASVFSAALASLRAISLKLVVFDTSVVDLSDSVGDPVEVLFAVQLGGGTDIAKALEYSSGLVTAPRDTIFVLISDLYEGGIRDQMMAHMSALVASGVRVITLLALSDSGAPAYDKENAAALAALGIPAFACTPDVFPEVMAAAINGDDVVQAARGSAGR